MVADNGTPFGEIGIGSGAGEPATPWANWFKNQAISLLQLVPSTAVAHSPENCWQLLGFPEWQACSSAPHFLPVSVVLCDSGLIGASQFYLPGRPALQCMPWNNDAVWFCFKVFSVGWLQVPRVPSDARYPGGLQGTGRGRVACCW